MISCCAMLPHTPPLTHLRAEARQVEVILDVVLVHFTEQLVAAQAAEPLYPGGLVLLVGAGDALRVFAVALGHKIHRLRGRSAAAQAAAAPAVIHATRRGSAADGAADSRA
eukprot:364463-Chlamydomonas_euryale.AAC.7